MKKSELTMIAFFIFGIWLISYLLQWISPPGGGIYFPFPLSIILLAALFLCNIIFFWIGRNHRLLVLFMSVPSALLLLLVFIIQVGLMSFFPHQPAFETQSWPFTIMVLLLIFHLGFITFKRILVSARQPHLDWGFIFVHGGLWFIFSILGVGAQDLQRWKIDLTEGKGTALARPSFGSSVQNFPQQFVELPFFIVLKKFELTEFPASFMLWDEKKQIAFVNPDQALIQIDHKKGTLLNWNIQVLNYILDAFPVQGEFVPAFDQGSTQAAFVEVSQIIVDGFKKIAPQDRKLRGWVSAGSFRQSPARLPLDFDEKGEPITSLALSIPRPKLFRSYVEIFDNPPQSKHSISAVIEMNKPFYWKGWRIYQMSYEEKKGKWSEKSVLEAIYDPWIYPFYLSIIIFFLGLFGMMKRWGSS